MVYVIKKSDDPIRGRTGAVVDIQTTALWLHVSALGDSIGFIDDGNQENPRPGCGSAHLLKDTRSVSTCSNSFNRDDGL